MHRRLLDALHSGDRGEKLEHLGVLRSLKCPGVLVEPAFLSSEVEGGRLATPEFRDTIASAILAGIEDYAALLRSLRPASVTPSSGAPGPAAARSQPTRPTP
jgi:N-acetylmuramoyl-L-alanine amidase